MGCTGPTVRPDLPAFDLILLSSDGQTSQLKRVELATGTQRQLTQGDSSLYGPVWVPGLARLIAATNETRPATLTSIDPVTGSMQSLWANPADDETPNWFADGSQSVYSLPMESGRALILSNFDGHLIRRLTPGTATDKQPVVSPDGTQVAFVSDRSGNQDIWTLTLATGELQNISQHPALEGHPAWHPDGRHLLFYRYEDGDADLILQGPNGTPTQIAPSPGNELIGQISPDGRWVAFGSVRTDDWEVFIIRTDGTGLRQITDRPGFDGAPVWVPR